MAENSLGLVLLIIGWATLILGIVLGNARIVGIGAAVLFIAEMTA